MSVKADLATGNIDSLNDRFSEKALQQLADQCIGLPIYLNFGSTIPPLGQILAAKVCDNRVEIDADIGVSLEHKLKKISEEGLISPYYIVAGFAIEEFYKDGLTRVIDKVILLETALTTDPCDTTQRPIFEIKPGELPESQVMIESMKTMLTDARRKLEILLPTLPDKAETSIQRLLQSKHGTPREFARVCIDAVGDISVVEARKAIERYRQQWMGEIPYNQ